MCKRELETTHHLFYTCCFSSEVWRVVSTLVGFNCQWEGDSIGAAWDSWWRRTPQKQFKILPLLVIWGIWLARNKAIFKDTSSTPAITGALAVGFYNSFPVHIRAAREQRQLDVDIDRSKPWDFFDGATQNNLCGGGTVLHLSESHFFVMSMGLGGGTNNFAELMSLKLLLMFPIEKGCTELNFLGDSMNVTNWFNQTQECRHLRLAHIIYSIRQLLLRYNSFSCRHVYRENNKKADKASKEGLRLAEGTWTVKETSNGRIQAFYHRPFIELY